jgi:hypothetical protein
MDMILQIISYFDERSRNIFVKLLVSDLREEVFVSLVLNVRLDSYRQPKPKV